MAEVRVFIMQLPIQVRMLTAEIVLLFRITQVLNVGVLATMLGISLTIVNLPLAAMIQGVPLLPL